MALFVLRVKEQHASSGDELVKYIKKECGTKEHYRLHIASQKDVKEPLADIQIFVKSEEEELGLASAIAKYIVGVREPEIIKSMLYKDGITKEEEELEQIYKSCMQLLADTLENQRSRRIRIDKVTTACLDYLKQHRLLHLEGFIAFWLKEYTNLLHETLEYAMEEYVLDRQYEEFIGLLQYFVYFQEPLTPVLHLIHEQGNEFNILNEHFNEVNVNYVQGVVARIADQELEMEDAIVSTLITLSPERIVLHTSDPEAVIISTIRRIFGQRVELCTGCTTCQLIHDKKSTN